jgi:hypothetical protein
MSKMGEVAATLQDINQITQGETMSHSKEFLTAYHELQLGLPLIEKSTAAFKYKYAPLENILKLWNPVFSEHGWVSVQSTVAGHDGSADIVSTKLYHEGTGEFVESSLTIPVSDDYQKIGSGVTYYRRYTLLTACGQQPVGEDFDGLKEEERPTKKKSPKAKAAKEDKEETGVHVAYEEFAKNAVDVVELTAFYVENKKAISNLTNDQQEKIIKTFAERKNELTQGSK